VSQVKFKRTLHRLSEAMSQQEDAMGEEVRRDLLDLLRECVGDDRALPLLVEALEAESSKTGGAVDGAVEGKPPGNGVEGGPSGVSASASASASATEGGGRSHAAGAANSEAEVLGEDNAPNVVPNNGAQNPVSTGSSLRSREGFQTSSREGGRASRVCAHVPADSPAVSREKKPRDDSAGAELRIDRDRPHDSSGRMSEKKGPAEKDGEVREERHADMWTSSGADIERDLAKEDAGRLRKRLQGFGFEQRAAGYSSDSFLSGLGSQDQRSNPGARTTPAFAGQSKSACGAAPSIASYEMSVYSGATWPIGNVPNNLMPNNLSVSECGAFSAVVSSAAYGGSSHNRGDVAPDGASATLGPDRGAEGRSAVSQKRHAVSPKPLPQNPGGGGSSGNVPRVGTEGVGTDTARARDAKAHELNADEVMNADDTDLKLLALLQSLGNLENPARSAGNTARGTASNASKTAADGDCYTGRTAAADVLTSRAGTADSGSARAGCLIPGNAAVNRDGESSLEPARTRENPRTREPAKTRETADRNGGPERPESGLRDGVPSENEGTQKRTGAHSSKAETNGAVASKPEKLRADPGVTIPTELLQRVLNTLSRFAGDDAYNLGTTLRTLFSSNSKIHGVV